MDMNGDLSAAENRIAAFNKRHPDDIRGWRVLSEVMVRKNDPKGTQDACKKALKLNPACPVSRGLLGLGLALSGDYRGAAKELGTVCKTSKTFSSHLDYGTFLHLSGKPQDAARAFRQAEALAVEAKSESRELLARFGLQRTLLADREITEFEEYDRKLISLYKTRPLWMASKMIYHFNRRDYFEWADYREKDRLVESLRQAPSNSPIPGLNTPLSFILPKDWDKLQAYAQETSKPSLWIFKRTGLFGGQGIELFEDLEQLPADLVGVVQKYIDDPALVNGRKAHMRLYLLFLNHSPIEAYFWKDGLVRFAPQPYERKEGWLKDKAMHITNTALHKGHPNLFFSDDAEIEDYGSVWGLGPYISKLADTGPSPTQLWDRLYGLAEGFVRLVQQSGFSERASAIPQEALLPKLIGIDAIFDSDFKPWFLEIQRNPGQSGPGPVNTINRRLYTNIFEMSLESMRRRVAGDVIDGGTFLERDGFIPVRL